MNSTSDGPIVNVRRRTLGKPVPAEGENGVFTQSWYPICMSTELPAGKILGTTFLDGRIVAFRGESGKVQVLSAYCPHLGADLAAGSVVGDNIKCAFHHWEFDGSGACAKTSLGDPMPPGACLFRFPTQERYGMIWAFNGEPDHRRRRADRPQRALSARHPVAQRPGPRAVHRAPAQVPARAPVGGLHPLR